MSTRSDQSQADVIRDLLDQIDKQAEKYDLDHRLSHDPCTCTRVPYRQWWRHVSRDVQLLIPDADEWTPSRATVERWDRIEREHRGDLLDSPVTGQRDPRGRKKQNDPDRF